MSSASVITLDSKEELLGIISAHVEYRLNAETKEQSPSYNLQAVEREVVMRYIGQRSRIKYEPEDLPTYMFSEDFNVLKQLQSLNESQVGAGKGTAYMLALTLLRVTLYIHRKRDKHKLSMYMYLCTSFRC